MPHRIRLIWRAAANHFEAVEGVDPVSPPDLDRIEAKIRTALEAFPALSHRAFALPEDLRAFYVVAEDQLALSSRVGERAFRFYAPAWLPTDGLALADEAAGDSTPWLEIGSHSESRWVFICCDPEDPLFGALVDRENCTPWSRTVHEAEVYPDLGDFLAALTTRSP